MKIEGYTFREEFLYDLDHSYTTLVSDEEIVQGITDLGQGVLGEVLFVEMSFVGRRVRQGDRLLSIQPMDPHGKVIRLKATVSGEIVAINPDLQNNPELINDAPYAEGWLVVIRPDDINELNNLHRPDESVFQAWVRREAEKMHLHEMRIGRKVTGVPAPKEEVKKKYAVEASYVLAAAK